MNVVDEIQKSTVGSGAQMIDGMTLPEAADAIAMFAGAYKRQYVIETWREGEITDGQAIARVFPCGLLDRLLYTGVAADVWSVTSFTLLRRDGLDAERHNLLNPDAKQAQVPYVTAQLEKTDGPIIASTDYMKLFADQIRQFVPTGRTFRVLGTDGYGRSDFRAKLREHFEANRHFVVLSALRA